MKTTRLIFKLIGVFVLFALFTNCSDKDPDSPTPPKILPANSTSLAVDTDTLFWERMAGTTTLSIVGKNLTEEISVSTKDSSWCSTLLSQTSVGDTLYNLEISYQTNNEYSLRTNEIQIRSGSISYTIPVVQQGLSETKYGIEVDVKVSIASGTASSFQGNEGIEKSFDGNYNTIYHSAWNNRGADYFPITLTYNLAEADTINYLIYYPRKSGANGRFKKFQIITIANGTETNHGTYELPNAGTPKRIEFSSPQTGVTSVKFIIEEGYGDGKGFASCAEMEFYKFNPKKFDYRTIFTDPSCSEIKTGIGMEQINSISNRFFRDLATEIYSGNYNTEFRVQTFQSYQHPDIQARINKTNTYGLRDNPTGMYALSGDEIIILADSINSNLSVSVFLQNPQSTVNGTQFALHTGVNTFKAPHDGLMYIMYYTDTGTEPDVKLHFALAGENGYFDRNKHTNDDYLRMINKAPFRHFDLKGDWVVMTFDTDVYREVTPDAMSLVKSYDELMLLEQDIMGLIKYDKQYKNRAYFVVTYQKDAYMYSTSYHTAYHESTLKEILNPIKIRRGAVWGPAHEVGHTHQTRPGILWIGLTEVTTNIYSLHVQTSWGNTSRLTNDGRYEPAVKEIVEGKIPHAKGGLWHKLVPFWQLKLYCDAIGKPDFYKDLHELIRTTPNPVGDGQCQLQFVKKACQAAQLDLTEFFEQWGFLTPVEILVEDYSKRTLKVTQEEVDTIKAEIKAMDLDKPKHSNIYLITDGNTDNYKN